MFKGKGGLGAMAGMLKDLPKIQKVIKTSLSKFESMEYQEVYQNMLTFNMQGSRIKNLAYSESYIELLGDDKELAEDMMVSGISHIQTLSETKKKQKLEADAKISGLNPALVNQIFNDELVSKFG
jgi:DNA-binding protein YbaB